MHWGCADPCEFPKCGNLDCIISGSGALRSRSPLTRAGSKTEFVAKFRLVWCLDADVILCLSGKWLRWLVRFLLSTSHVLLWSSKAGEICLLGCSEGVRSSPACLVAARAQCGSATALLCFAHALVVSLCFRAPFVRGKPQKWQAWAIQDHCCLQEPECSLRPEWKGLDRWPPGCSATWPHAEALLRHGWYKRGP